jgi:hypothetical protein
MSLLTFCYCDKTLGPIVLDLRNIIPGRSWWMLTSWHPGKGRREEREREKGGRGGGGGESGDKGGLEDVPFKAMPPSDPLPPTRPYFFIAHSSVHSPMN